MAEESSLRSRAGAALGALRSRRTLRKETTVASATGALLIAGCVAGLQLSLRRAEERLRWVAHTHEVISLAQSVARDSLEAQSAFRGFLSSRDPSFVRQFTEGNSQFEHDAAALSALVADNPPQVARAAELRELYRRWRNDTATPAITAAPSSAAAQGPAANAGDERLLHLREALARFVSVEELLLEERQAASEVSTRQLRLVSIAGTALVVLGGFGSAVFFMRRVTRRLSQVTATAQALAQGDLSRRLEAKGFDEISDLARSFNEMASQLQERHREAHALDELREMLHAADTLADAQRIVPTLVPKCLPGSSGALHLLNASRTLLAPVAAWGAAVDGEPFAPDDCWSLRLGRTHTTGGADGGVPCAHARVSDLPSSCVPLLAQGQTVGLLQLSIGGALPRLATEVAETLALTVANLLLREALRNQAIRDGLTGLFNRRYLDETLARELARARRAGQPLSVVMLDVDHFKRFNDTHGHAAGDGVLKAVAGVLRSTFRTADVVCRYGGEELLVLMPDCGHADALKRAEAVLAAVRDLHLSHDGRTLEVVTLSAGVATFPQHGQDEEALVQAADAALYRSKRAGRDRVTAAQL